MSLSPGLRTDELPVMRRAALVLIVTCGAFATAAAATTPPVVTHTYKVAYLLTGHYHEVSSFTEAAGYCNGTGYVEDADFTVSAGAKVKVKLQSGIAVGGARPDEPRPGHMEDHGHRRRPGRRLHPAPQRELHRRPEMGRLEHGPRWLLVVSRGHLIAFSYHTSIPHEGLAANDCNAASGDYGPPRPRTASRRR